MSGARSPWRTRGAAWLCMLMVLLAGCSSLPSHQPSEPSAAIADDTATPLSEMMAKVLPADTRSGFRLLPYGPNSFATRVELARLATRSLDVQYYLLAGDNTGLALMRALRDAAARGVRVRVLVDDLYTAGEDDLLLALASYPNVEVRLFNPFAGGRGSDLTRFISAGLDFRRVDRRMHNKLFVADNTAAVTGGRNMADAYVMNAAGSNFVDMDVFAAGPVVHELSSEFDHYWNSEVVYPVRSIASSALTPAQLQEGFERKSAAAIPPEALDAPDGLTIHHDPDGHLIDVSPDLARMLNTPFELANHRLTPLLWAHARVLYDPLTKTGGWNESRASLKGTVTEGVVRWMYTADHDIKMTSPYFVPSDGAVASIVAARKHGVDFQIVTNSLASTDEPWVYGAYWPHLKALLASGVQIEELSPTLSVRRRRSGIFGNRTGALHMKNAIVDHQQVFLGSMNLDQRSAVLNTELGIIIESPEMAHQLESFADAGSAYRLRLSADGQGIQWVAHNDDGTETVFDVPPETTAWQRFKLRLLGPFIPVKEL